MMKAHLRYPCLQMPHRTPQNQTSASPLTGPHTQPRQMTTVPRPPALPRNTNMIPRLSPPPYRDSPSPTLGPSRLSTQHQSGLGPLPPPLQPSLQQLFILHFSVPHATVIRPGHSSNQRYMTQTEREDGSATVCCHPQTRIHPLPHSLVEEVNRLPR